MRAVFAGVQLGQPVAPGFGLIVKPQGKQTIPHPRSNVHAVGNKAKGGRRSTSGFLARGRSAGQQNEYDISGRDRAV